MACAPAEPEVNLIIPQGTSWGWQWDILDPVTGDPMDLTGWSIKGQIKASYESAIVLYEWNSDTDNASTSASGVVEISVTPEESTEWTWRFGRYDLELISPDGQVARIAQGSVKLSREVTK